MTPYELLRRTTPVQDATKAELLRLTRRLERAALQSPPPAVAATLQDQRYFTDRTREVAGADEDGDVRRQLDRRQRRHVSPGGARRDAHDGQGDRHGHAQPARPEGRGEREHEDPVVLRYCVG